MPWHCLWLFPVAACQVKPMELTDFLQLKKSEGYCIVGVEQTANSQSLQDYQFPEKTLLLLGYGELAFAACECMQAHDLPCDSRSDKSASGWQGRLTLASPVQCVSLWELHLSLPPVRACLPSNRFSRRRCGEEMNSANQNRHCVDSGRGEGKKIPQSSSALVWQVDALLLPSVGSAGCENLFIKSHLESVINM